MLWFLANGIAGEHRLAAKSSVVTVELRAFHTTLDRFRVCRAAPILVFCVCSDLAALQPKGPKQELRKKWIGDYLEKVDKAYGPPDEKGLRWLRKVAYLQRCDSKGKPT